MAMCTARVQMGLCGNKACKQNEVLRLYTQNQSVVSFSELLKDSKEALFEIKKEGTEVHQVKIWCKEVKERKLRRVARESKLE